MLPTPDTSHVAYDRIYEPAEDSYLLLDTLSSTSESAYLHKRFAAESTHGVPTVLEVGPGSGVVLAFAAAQSQHIFGRSDVLTLGCDINHFACEAAQKTVQRAVAENKATNDKQASHAQFLDIINGDLTTCFVPGSIDVLIFNPPYVPADLPDLSKHAQYNNATGTISSTDAWERDSHLLALSYAGGADGMEITNRLLEQLPDLLHPVRGVAYILLCAQNKPNEVKANVDTWPGNWSAEIVGTSGKTAGWEKLCILRIAKEMPHTA